MASRGHFRGSAKHHPLAGGARRVGLPKVYAGRGRHNLRDLYEMDHGSTPPGGRFRWLMSTVLAAAIGSIAIFTVIYGSVDSKESASGFLPTLARIGSGEIPSPMMPHVKRLEGLNWFTPKSDRMEVANGAGTMRFVIQEKLHQRRNGRDYIHAKPYVRILARLGAPTDTTKQQIPSFNPFKLYANSAPIQDGDGDQVEATSNANVVVRVVELLGGILPVEDGQRLDDQEAREIVVRDSEAMRAPLSEAAGGLNIEDQAAPVAVAQQQPNTTNLIKTVLENNDATDDFDDGELTVVKVGKGDTLKKNPDESGRRSMAGGCDDRSSARHFQGTGIGSGERGSRHARHLAHRSRP